MSEERHEHDLEVEAEREEETPPLDPELEARRAAAMSFIRRLGDPVLKSRATEVDRFDESLRRQVSRMAGIMGDALGVGLAAPQLGISQRLLVYRVGPEAPVIALVNPQIEWWSDELEALDEGCLSIPGIMVDVERPLHVRELAEAAGAKILEGNTLDFLDPWGNRIQVVEYRDLQFTKTPAVLKFMGLDLDKSEEAEAELRKKGIEP